MRHVGSWRGVDGRKRMFGDGINMYDAVVEPNDFTGVKPSKYPNVLTPLAPEEFPA